MENKKQKIIDILDVSVLVSQESKQKILGKLDSLSEDQLDALLVLLSDAEETQERLIKKVLEVHPDFLDFLEKYTDKEINEARIEAENKSNKIDKGEIINLEEELDKL